MSEQFKCEIELPKTQVLKSETVEYSINLGDLLSVAREIKRLRHAEAKDAALELMRSKPECVLREMEQFSPFGLLTHDTMMAVVSHGNCVWINELGEPVILFTLLTFWNIDIVHIKDEQRKLFRRPDEILMQETLAKAKRHL